MSNIQIDPAVLEAIATHLRKFGFSQPAMIADKIDAILRDHAAREQAAVTTSTPDISEAYKRSTAEPVDDLRPYETNPNWPDTPTQSGECEPTDWCVCGHAREYHDNAEGECFAEILGDHAGCVCREYRDRARGGR